jgi:hypothetical protein
MSKLLAVHQDPESGEPLGVWLSPTSNYYNSMASKPDVDYAAFRMATQFPDLSWDQWCEYLSGQRPTVVMWTAVPAEAGETPESAYRRVQALFASPPPAEDNSDVASADGTAPTEEGATAPV